MNAQPLRPVHSNRWASGPFLVAFLLLLTAALGMHPLIDRVSGYYRKTPIPPLRPFAEFRPESLPSFQAAPESSPFIDLQPGYDVGADDVLFVRLQEKNALGHGGQAILFVTYYSNENDRVPHTPEVCYRQISGVVRSVGTVDFELNAAAAGEQRITARTVVVEQPGVNAAIAYVFCANGKFCTDRNMVRLTLGWPGDKHVYFSKIEAIAASDPSGDPAIAFERCRRLLSEAVATLVDEHFPPRSALVRD